MSALSSELEWRGLVHQMTAPDDLPSLLDNDSLTVYIGFDPTADSLHVGNLMQLCTLRRLQEAGHRPIALAGGGTGMIGDPGGKSEERNLLTKAELETNLAGIRQQLGRFLDFSEGPNQAVMEDNGEWLWSIRLLEFLRDIGKHFTVNQMVAKESVKTRFEGRDQGISYTEFSYMLLQAYDFVHLFETHDCRLQVGGSDQWGNITMGVELVRKLKSEQAYGLTTPLVLKPDGTKFGKSETGTVWLDPKRTSPYQLFQFFVRVEDSVVGTYLRYFTWLPRERIEELDRATAEHPEAREAARALAYEVTKLVHGADEADRALHASEVLFTDQIASLDEATLLDVFAEAPSVTISRAELDGDGHPLIEALAATGISKSDARRALQQRGAYVNNRQQDDIDRRLTPADLIHDRYVLLRRGKKNQTLLRFE
jgi:tyrosyl-tRNA synthetase